MKYLIRGEKGNFLEAELIKDWEFTPTEVEVNPRDLIHFGTDLINNKDLEDYAKEMEKNGVDYLFVSGEHKRFVSSTGPCGTRLEVMRDITAYLKK
jgi:hypothetical protein